MSAQLGFVGYQSNVKATEVWHHNNIQRRQGLPISRAAVETGDTDLPDRK